MARWVKAPAAGELAPGQGKLVQVDGQDIALFDCPWRAFDFHDNWDLVIAAFFANAFLKKAG